MTTASIAISAAQPTKHDVRNGVDHDVTIKVDGRTIEGGITLRPSEYDGRMSTWGSLDMWASGPIVKWLLTLTDDSRQAVARALEGGPDDFEIDVEVNHSDG
jgi:hypothetical protein